MALTLKSFAQFLSDLQNGIIAVTNKITTFTEGSVALAMNQSVGTQLGFVQSQAPIVLAVTRAATCDLPDLITFVEDYYLTPPWLPPTYATGVATFTRNQVSTSPQVLLDGTIIQNVTPSPTSALQYTVTANTSDPKWSANAGGTGLPGRTLPAGQSSLTGVTIQANTVGTAGEVVANVLKLIASPSVPFDTVTNPNDINNASDGETVQQLRQRFSDFISSRSCTRFFIASEVAGVQAGITFTINDLTLPNGTYPVPGVATIVADDGSGSGNATFLANVLAAVTGPSNKSVGAYIQVVAPTNVNVTVAVTGCTAQVGFSLNDVESAIQAAIVTFVNSNGVGGAPAGTGSGAPTLKLSYVSVANLVASFIGTATGQGLASYAEVTLNGAQADIPLTVFQLARTSANNVLVS